MHLRYLGEEVNRSSAVGDRLRHLRYLGVEVRHYSEEKNDLRRLRSLAEGSGVRNLMRRLLYLGEGIHRYLDQEDSRRRLRYLEEEIHCYLAQETSRRCLRYSAGANRGKNHPRSGLGEETRQRNVLNRSLSRITESGPDKVGATASRRKHINPWQLISHSDHCVIYPC
jgi:hypothetical protein